MLICIVHYSIMSCMQINESNALTGKCTVGLWIQFPCNISVKLRKCMPLATENCANWNPCWITAFASGCRWVLTPVAARKRSCYQQIAEKSDNRVSSWFDKHRCVWLDFCFEKALSYIFDRDCNSGVAIKSWVYVFLECCLSGIFVDEVKNNLMRDL